MTRRRSFLGLSTALALVVSTAGVVGAQGEPPSPEGQAWELRAYAADAALTPVPEDVVATLLLADGVASGSAGCNQFSGSYTLDGSSLSIAPEMAQTMMACDPAIQAVEDAYVALLPTTASWQSAEAGLQLLDADDTVILEYAAPTPDLATVIALLEQLRADVGQLQARVEALEAGAPTDGPGTPDGDAGSGTGGGDGTASSTIPAQPRARGSVDTTFPAWMRDGRPPDQIANKNREIVRWRDRADDEAGYRVYARRGYCQLKPGTNPDQALEEDDFRLGRTKAVRIDRLPADTTRYRPDHQGIDDALPEMPASPYSNDQFYDLYVTAFNAAGESKRVLVGSYFLTPEFRCP